jgi:hypothetical protein
LICLENRQQRISIHGLLLESEMLQVSSGGSIYDQAVGSGSYTDWIYSAALNGWGGDNDNYCFSMVLE